MKNMKNIFKNLKNISSETVVDAIENISIKPLMEKFKKI
jgi:hypothetical protein